MKHKVPLIKYDYDKVDGILTTNATETRIVKIRIKIGNYSYDDYLDAIQTLSADIGIEPDAFCDKYMFVVKGQCVEKDTGNIVQLIDVEEIKK